MMRPLLATLVLAAATTAAAAPGPASGDLAIRSVEVRPSDPVVGPSGSVRVVVDVVARGADRVSVVLEPGRAPSGGGEPGGEPEPDVTPSPPSASPDPVSPEPAFPEGSAVPVTVPAVVPLPGLGGLASAAVPGVVGASRTGGRPARRASSGEWETWRFLPDKRLSRWYPHGPWTVTATAVNARGERVVAHAGFNLRRATEIEGLKVVRDGDTVRVTGTLLRVDPVGKVDYRPFAGQRIEIRFRPAGSSRWKTVGEAVTRRDGWFSVRVRADGEGTWRAEYAGTSRYAADASPQRRA
ncbi:hypothetical protein GCM10010116_47370 [Microbispora rosea subsp. aerata]|nr:hypothetical protein [Microbispora rosea]GGO23495.1 hypothetical protein GCM10010116_47370 [Microbispora rosea subsp. aerata]GIH57835.1 hypothetical protein Mro02_47490 [Microbispora rosea subsp. aerata]GLJ84448.1 hypothetical protein GCM10017588_31760 [Microbispora rosea subsp. aerata]